MRAVGNDVDKLPVDEAIRHEGMESGLYLP